MNVAVIAALITGGASLLGVIITTIAGNRKITAKLELTQAVMQKSAEMSQAVTLEKIANLAEEVRTHNNFARRMPVVEEKVCNIERRLDVIESERRIQ